MKKKSTYIIILLTLSFAILLIKFIESQSQKRVLENSIDTAYKVQLSNVLGSFSLQVNDYTYRSMISSVYSVAVMSKLTSFEEVNDDLDISLYNLYISLREEKSKDKVLARVEELHEIFSKMLQDPASKEATNKLIQISNETFFSVEE
ncbi:hypothetical protein AWU65_28545 [Paenibacillus glucanolyticus]|uniref:Uncharacterized protein n=1 Tax=Paenibacillus glucanolyticus TaxID=59843 RepID=A0A163EUI9_9BACL|nr:hypothetical protein [Paenibacillus glucanolyticus]KZS44026.1 hypothetical protein AWU65_28545 [Paenibacillus glucanolyticus]